ncbi:hypothetical protein EG329_009028 [Mollisiaceae sp. DMI_Dod_QoI]|nr:hypothetical protein EG329_009028 [Helotiales sp. DMI_Dod_QoI]
MNWATIAPETRLFKGKNLFRWEVSPGLEHHCGVCATPLHNSRAKTSCIGKHVEPCYRFHQQLHFVGKSHECFGCNTSDEMHHNRHKEILRIVRQINALDDSASLFSNRNLFGKPRKASANIISTTDTSSESQGPEEMKLTRRERKKAKKSSNNSVKDKQHIEVFPKEEVDFISEAIHLTVHESKGAWEGTYVYDHKLPEAEDETVVLNEEQDNFDAESVTTSIGDLAVKPPDDMTPRQRKTLKKFTSAVDHSSFKGGSRKYGSPKLDLYNGVDPEIFSRLGIDIVVPINHSKGRKDLATKLVAAIKEDIETITREDVDTVMREEGFWRWAGKTAYWHIVDTRKDFDWATGQKRGAPRFDFLEEEMELEEGESIDSTQEPLPEPEPQQELMEEGFTTVVSKKVAAQAKKEKMHITLQSKGQKKALNRPTFTQDFLPIEEEESTDDFQEMVRRHEQRVAGENTLGRWNPPPSPYLPPHKRGKKVLVLN